MWWSLHWYIVFYCLKGEEAVTIIVVNTRKFEIIKWNFYPIHFGVKMDDKRKKEGIKEKTDHHKRLLGMLNIIFFFFKARLFPLLVMMLVADNYC